MHNNLNLAEVRIDFTVKLKSYSQIQVASEVRVTSMAMRSLLVNKTSLDALSKHTHKPSPA